MNETDPGDAKALRAMGMMDRLTRGLNFMEQARQFKIASVRVHHPGWSEENIMDEVRRWVRDGMKPEELYELSGRQCAAPSTILISSLLRP